jgi:hypothetical protein
MLYFRGFGQHGFACGLIGVRSKIHINRLNHSRVRWVGYRLILRLKTVG